MSGEEERLHKEKWRIWNEQREREQIKKKINIQEGVQNYAVNLIKKINSPFEKNNDKHNKQISKQIGHQIQSNVCSICLELMIPPDRQPIILFPCGHNLCKDCIFDNPPKGPIKKNLKLKLDKCTLCRQKIESYALNQSLMALICTYSNNKDLLAKQQQRLLQEEANNAVEEDIEQLRIRCNILEKEQLNLISESQKLGRQKGVLSEVIDTLKKQKKKNEREMEKLEQQAKLISKCLTDKIEEMQLLEKKMRETQDKERVLEKALGPLRKQKQKQQLLQIARLVSKK